MSPLQHYGQIACNGERPFSIRDVHASPAYFVRNTTVYYVQRNRWFRRAPEPFVASDTWAYVIRMLWNAEKNQKQTLFWKRRCFVQFSKWTLEVDVLDGLLTTIVDTQTKCSRTDPIYAESTIYYSRRDQIKIHLFFIFFFFFIGIIQITLLFSKYFSSSHTNI